MTQIRKLLSIFWLLAWRQSLGGGACFAVGSGLSALLGGGLIGAYLIALIPAIAWQAFVVQMALNKQYHDFRLVLEPTAPLPKRGLAPVDKVLLGAAAVVLLAGGIFVGMSLSAALSVAPSLSQKAASPGHSSAPPPSQYATCKWGWDPVMSRCK